MEYLKLELEQKKELEVKIKKMFTQRRLYKGAAEVVKALIEHKGIEMIYLIGDLDPWYEKAITGTINEVGSPCQLVRLDKSHIRMVYDALRVDQQKPRRFFQTRTFAF